MGDALYGEHEFVYHAYRISFVICAGITLAAAQTSNDLALRVSLISTGLLIHLQGFSQKYSVGDTLNGEQHRNPVQQFL